jgi:hypothetical protein
LSPAISHFAFKPANDQHPNHNVSLGDVLIAGVFEAVRNSPVWAQTLLVVLWDEHGGIYDHAFPSQPRVPVSVDPPFDFDPLGVHVPAVLISSYIPGGAVDHPSYEHASVPAILKKLFGLSGFLAMRDAAANASIISLDIPRTDAPARLPRVPEAASTATRAAKLPFLLNPGQRPEAEKEGVISNAPLSQFQQSLAALAFSIATAGADELTAAPEVPRVEHLPPSMSAALAISILGSSKNRTRWIRNVSRPFLVLTRCRAGSSVWRLVGPGGQRVLRFSNRGRYQRDLGAKVKPEDNPVHSFNRYEIRQITL